MVDNCVHAMLAQGVINVYDFAVYCTLLRIASPEAKAFPSLKTLARRSGISVSQAQKSRQRLLQCGLLVWETRQRADRGDTSAIYTVICPESDDPDSSETGGGLPQHGNGGYRSTVTGLPQHGNPCNMVTNKTHVNKTEKQIHDECAETARTSSTMHQVSESKSQKPKPLPADWDYHWQAFRRAYPKRAGDPNVKRGKEIYKSLLAQGVEPATILQSLRCYAAYCEASNIVGTPLVQQISTWLNRRNWDNDVDYGLVSDEEHRAHVRRALETKERNGGAQ
ncbi:MAG: helix-turn-helix domain-containing protein [Fimbriimonadia bacterium]|nr:helix-turn-helix domain-containing protein [Fimbriimonadia bacterium]